jgi:hypothetical protein
MPDEGRYFSIIPAHHFITFFQSGFPVCGAKTGFQKTGQRLMRVEDMIRPFQATNAPLEIGYIPVLQIINAGYFPSDDKRLVADKHAHLKAFPSQPFRGFQPAHT